MHTTTVTTMDTTTRITNRNGVPKWFVESERGDANAKHHNQAFQIPNKNQHGVLNSRNHRFVIDTTEGFKFLRRVVLFTVVFANAHPELPSIYPIGSV